jgi:triosephosphate isomerase
MQEILKNIGSGNIEKTVLCYEPVWAISSNNPDVLPTENEIMEARLLMKKFLVKKYGKLTADRVKIIYGGSVDQNNVSETCLETGMRGALIGSASTKPYDFVKIIKELEN